MQRQQVRAALQKGRLRGVAQCLAFWARRARTLSGDSGSPLSVSTSPPPAAAMSGRGGKGFYATPNGDYVSTRPGAPNGRQNNSTNNSVISISDSDSDSDADSEGFFEDHPIYSKSNGKASSGSKSNGKASSGSLKTGGKSSSFSEGEAGKGGKGFSAGKGGKGSTSNAKPAKSDAEIKLELDMPPNSTILMNCEAAEMLQQIHEHMAILSEDPKIKIPECFDKAFQYAKEGNHFTTAKSVKQILDPLKKYGVNDGEICMIANIGPETIDEVYALVPSLKATKAINEGLITEALAALANIKASK